MVEAEGVGETGEEASVEGEGDEWPEEERGGESEGGGDGGDRGDGVGVDPERAREGRRARGDFRGEERAVEGRDTRARTRRLG